MNHIHIRIVVAVLVISMFLGYNFYHFFPYVFLPYTYIRVQTSHMNICRIRMHVVPVYMRTHVRAGTLKAVMFVALVHMIGELCHGFERSLATCQFHLLYTHFKSPGDG